MTLFGNKYSLYNMARFDAASDAAAAAAAAAAQPSAWVATAGLEGETLGHAQNRGWDKLTAEKAAFEAIKAHREAEKLIGVPAAEMVRLPKPEDTAGWDVAWRRLGKPEEAKGYDLSTIKYADGTAIEQPFADAIRAAAYRNNLPKAAATEFAKDLVKYIDGQDAADATTSQAALLAEKQKLRENWGKNYDAFHVVAEHSAKALGVSPEAILALESQVGYAAVMNMFYTIGTKIGEDSFITKMPGGGGGAMTKEQAIARRAELQGDPEWTARYLKGGAAENKEFQALIAIEKA